MSMFYKELGNEDLAKMSFAELRKHAIKAIQNTTDLSDFHYAENVMQHCIARLTYDPHRRRSNDNRNQGHNDGNRQQNQSQGNDQRRR
jgi:hypothetical protein